MSKVIVQVPVSKELRNSAEAVAEEYGFSSLQEVMRIFMKKFANRSVSFTMEESAPLSLKAQRRYQKMSKDLKQKKNTYSAKTVTQLMKQLHGNRLS